MTLTIVHCAEDALAAGASKRLLDRVVAERAQAAWIQDLWSTHTADARKYVDLEGREGWSDRSDASAARRNNVRFHPRGLHGNAVHAYVCCRMAAMMDIEGDWILLLAFDTDGKPELGCGPGVEKARETNDQLVVVMAEAKPEFDCWVLAGFDPKNEHEERLLASEIKALADAGYPFNPVLAPHRLTSTRMAMPETRRPYALVCCN